MITQEEIKIKAIEFDIHHTNVERDYVFGWLLKSIFENDYLLNALVFKGGNCLRKAFYPDTRFSADLDFSAPNTINLEKIAHEINAACRIASLACGVEFLIDRNTFEPGPAIDHQKQSYKGRVYFTDFFGKQDDLTISIKVDITEYDRPYLEPVMRSLIHPYSDTNLCNAELRCTALEEIVANKLKCLIQRRHSHDLFDLVYTTFIDRSIQLDRSLVLRTFLNKTIFSPNPGAAKEILLGLPLTFFGGVWDKFIRCPKPTRFGFDRAIEGFNTAIEALFEGIQVRTGGEQAFFPSEHRNLIMEAGAERKLLRLTYDGVQRLVEPYSLAYKRPSTGNPKEYFYAYDRSGGRSSPPGIKSFIHSGINKLELVEEKFEPRYEIELAKAGEEARKDYFGQAFSNTDSPSLLGASRRHSLKSFRQSYKIQCPYCQKLFTRTTSSLALKPHKAPNGYRCGGRHGYRIY